MKIKMLKTSLWADASPHLPHRSLIKDETYTDLPDIMAKSIIRQKFGIEILEEDQIDENPIIDEDEQENEEVLVEEDDDEEDEDDEDEEEIPDTNETTENSDEQKDDDSEVLAENSDIDEIRPRRVGRPRKEK